MLAVFIIKPPDVIYNTLPNKDDPYYAEENLRIRVVFSKVGPARRPRIQSTLCILPVCSTLRLDIVLYAQILGFAPQF